MKNLAIEALAFFGFIGVMYVAFFGFAPVLMNVKLALY